MGRKKEKFTLNGVEITGYAAQGRSFFKHDSKVVFVPHCVPSDVIDVEVYKQKKSYAEGRVLKIVNYSDKRVGAKCPHSLYCGGCSWQELAYSWQLQYKQQEVIDALQRIGKIDCSNILPIVASDEIYYYRNKLEFTFASKSWTPDYVKGQETDCGLGFHISGQFDKVLPISHCVLQKDPSNAIRNFIFEYCKSQEISFYDARLHQGMMRNLIIRTSQKEDLMVLVVFAQNDETVIHNVMQKIKDEFPQITSLQYCINDKMNDSLGDRQFVVFNGKDHIMEYMPRYDDTNAKPLQFKIRPKTFYQTNPKQALKLYTIAAQFADIHSQDIVYDLYTGTGTIANFISNKAKKVVGIEYVEDAVEDAKLNSKENMVNNTFFFAGDMAKVLDDNFVQLNGKPSIIITDPPRGGMAEKVVEQILKIGAKKVVYISCNPATQARDLSLMNKDYNITKIQPLDMFPHTHHIENIVLLEKKI